MRIGGFQIGPSDAPDEVAKAPPGQDAGPTPAPDLGPTTKIGRLLSRTVADLFANAGLMRSPGIDDFRSVEAAERVMTEPLATAPGHKPFGPVTVFRPGLANTHASPAFLFRAARYTDNLVVAWPNAKPGQDLTPVPATEIDGVPVPPELRGRIFVSGDPSSRMIPWEQASELFEAQLEALGHSGLLPGDGLDGAGLTVLAHSQGGLDAAETRRRLEAEGRGDAIGRLVTLNSPFKGSPLSDESGFGLLGKALGMTVGGQAPKALLNLDPDYMARRFGARDQRLVDVAVAASTDGDERQNLRPLMKGLATINRFNPFSRSRGPSDGFVARDSMRFGLQRLELDRAYDHAGIAEDPAVIDDVARALAGRG